MKSRGLSYYLILLLLVGACAISWSLYFKDYRGMDTVDISAFPTTIKSWTSEEIQLTPTELAILETDNAFVRKYTSPAGHEIFLFIVYSQNNRKVSHPPEICYTGGGATIVESESIFIPVESEGESIRANQFTVERGPWNQVVSYWFKIGEDFTANYWKQQGMIALKKFLGHPSSSALIRISASFEEGQKDEAAQLVKNFGTMIAPYIPQYLP